MNVLVDTDVILDFALDRGRFGKHAADLFLRIEQGMISAVVAFHTVSNLYYLLSGEKSDKKARDFLQQLLKKVEVPSVGQAQVMSAFQFNMKDFEDALQVATALTAGASRIVTRNLSDYKNSPIRAVGPRDVVKELTM